MRRNVNLGERGGRATSLGSPWVRCEEGGRAVERMGDWQAKSGGRLTAAAGPWFSTSGSDSEDESSESDSESDSDSVLELSTGAGGGVGSFLAAFLDFFSFLGSSVGFTSSFLDFFSCAVSESTFGMHMMHIDFWREMGRGTDLLGGSLDLGGLLLDLGVLLRGLDLLVGSRLGHFGY